MTTVASRCLRKFLLIWLYQTELLQGSLFQTITEILLIYLFKRSEKMALRHVSRLNTFFSIQDNAKQYFNRFL